MMCILTARHYQRDLLTSVYGLMAQIYAFISPIGEQPVYLTLTNKSNRCRLENRFASGELRGVDFYFHFPIF